MDNIRNNRVNRTNEEILKLYTTVKAKEEDLCI